MWEILGTCFYVKYKRFEASLQIRAWRERFIWMHEQVCAILRKRICLMNDKYILILTTRLLLSCKQSG